MPSVSDTRSYFDRHAGQLARDQLVDKSDALRPFFAALPERARVLECGAGTGLYTIPLLRAGHRVVAVDLSDQSLGALRTAAAGDGLDGGLTTLCGDFSSVLESVEGDFDAIMFVKVLHHFPSPDFIADCIARSYARLRPGGAILIFEPNGDNPLWRPLLRARGRAHYDNEKNVFLIRRKLFERIFAAVVPSAKTVQYKYVVPGGLLKRLPALKHVDDLLSRGPDVLLRRLAANIYIAMSK